MPIINGREIKGTRIFGGKTYTYLTSYTRKADAQRHVQSLRKKGAQARIVKVCDKWAVYWRP